MQQDQPNKMAMCNYDIPPYGPPGAQSGFPWAHGEQFWAHGGAPESQCKPPGAQVGPYWVQGGHPGTQGGPTLSQGEPTNAQVITRVITEWTNTAYDAVKRGLHSVKVFFP